MRQFLFAIAPTSGKIVDASKAVDFSVILSVALCHLVVPNGGLFSIYLNTTGKCELNDV